MTRHAPLARHTPLPRPNPKKIGAGGGSGRAHNGLNRPEVPSSCVAGGSRWRRLATTVFTAYAPAFPMLGLGGLCTPG